MTGNKLRGLALATATAISCGFISAGTQAADVTLIGDSVQAVITDKGVLSSLIFDPSGTGTFNPSNDYISPGIPFEAFAVRIGPSTFLENSNSGPFNINGSTVAGIGNSAIWTGTAGGLFTLQHVFQFNTTDQRVNITTTLTPLSDLTDVRISRAADPDPDSLSHGTASTNNQRGIPSNTPPVPVTDFVGSLGAVSGLPLGLFFSGPITHNTGLSGDCCSQADPDFYLAGGDLGDSSSGDNGIGIAFALGNLTTGTPVTWSYAYVMGGSLGTIDIPEPPTPGGTAPEPGMLSLVGVALAGFGALRRRKKA